jgi:Mg-chelatase subunit ChlD
VRLLIDTSASMGYYGKLRHAQRVAAALGFCALVRRDAVAVHTFAADRAPRRFTSRSSTPALFAHLASLAPSGDTRFLAAATSMLAEPGPRGLTVVITDLLTPEWDVALRRLPARGSDVALVHLLAREELDPGTEADIRGDVELVDAETGRPLGITASSDELAEHARRIETWRHDVASACAHQGIAFVPVRAGDDVGDLLLGPMRARGVLR